MTNIVVMLSRLERDLNQIELFLQTYLLCSPTWALAKLTYAQNSFRRLSVLQEQSVFVTSGTNYRCPFLEGTTLQNCAAGVELQFSDHFHVCTSPR